MKRAPPPVVDGGRYHNGPLWRQLYCRAVGDPHSLATGENRQNARQGGDLCCACDQGWRVPTMVRSPPFTTFWRRLADDDAPGGEVPFALAAECRLWRGKPTAVQAVAASANDCQQLKRSPPDGR